MADTTFTNGTTVLPVWLNDVNDLTYGIQSSASTDTGDALIAVKNTATGAVARTQHSKNEETFSLGDFGGSPSASAAVNDTALAAALAHLKTNGGVLKSLPRGTYNFSTAKTLIEDTSNSSVQAWEIDGCGSTWSWASSGLTSGTLLKVGATSISTVHENGFFKLRNLRIIGPETDNCSVSGGVNFPTPATTVIGLELSFCLDPTLDNVFIRRCYKGIKCVWSWPIHAWGLNCAANYIGLHLSDTCTEGDWHGCSFQSAAYGILMRPDNTGGNIEAQNFWGTRFENSLQPITMDPNESGSNTTVFRNICFFGNRFEQNAYDLLRIGKAWTFDTPQTPGTDRTDYSQGIFLYGGSWDAPVGAGTNYRVNGSTNGFIRGGDFNIPVSERTQINGTYVAVTMHIQPDPNGGATSGNTYFPDGSTVSLGSNRILTGRQTGWTAATGTATRTTFATNTVTTEQLAQRVKALIDDLIAHGLIGT